MMNIVRKFDNKFCCDKQHTFFIVSCDVGAFKKHSKLSELPKIIYYKFYDDKLISLP